MRIDDRIQKEVIAEIHRDPLLYNTAAGIGVTVKNQVVTLFGTVDRHALRIAAAKAALRVRCVNIIALDITLKGSISQTLIGDSEIGQAIHDVFKTHKEIKQSLIISVENGWIYLEGVVQWTSEKLTAKQLIEKIPGVKGVINKIMVKNSPLKSEEIQKTILAEFERYLFIDPENIEVEVVEKTVKLSGEVQSWNEADDAEALSYAIPGVNKVINNLTVDFEIYAN